MDPRSNFRRSDAPSSGSTKLAAKTEATRWMPFRFHSSLTLGASRLLPDSVTERAAFSHGSHAIWTAWAQMPMGWPFRGDRPNASKEGIACR